MTSLAPSTATSDAIGMIPAGSQRGPAWRGVLRRLGQGLSMLAGGFLLYMAIGSLFSFVMDLYRNFELAPLLPRPILELLQYGEMVTSNEDATAPPFWERMVRIPSELISFPAWTFESFKEALSTRPERLTLAGLHLLVALPVIVPLVFGFAFWWRRSRVVALAAALPVMLAITEPHLFSWLAKLNLLQMSHTNGVVS